MANEQYIVPLPVIKRDNKVLLVFKHTSSVVYCANKWELPGSRVAFGQTFEASLKDKTKRLIGIDVEIKEILGMVHSNVSDRMDGDGQSQCFVIPVVCETDATDFVIDESKLREARWFSLNQIEELYNKGDLVDKNDLEIARMVLTG